MSSSLAARVAGNYSFSITFGSPTRTYLILGDSEGGVVSVVENVFGRFSVRV